jgi:predicted thioesterase
MENIAPGLIGTTTLMVAQENTARHLGSGNVYVFATPEMVRLMEMAGVSAVDHLLPQGYRTVGMAVNVKHLAATPMGMKVTARAELVEVDGRKLHFRVEAWDEQEKIGEGTHTRAIIDVQKFSQRVEEKAARADKLPA